MLELTQEQRAAVVHAVRYYIAEAATWSRHKNPIAETLKPILAEMEKLSEPHKSLLHFVPGKQPPETAEPRNFGEQCYDQHGRFVG